MIIACLFLISLVVKGRAWLSFWGIAKLSRCGKFIDKNGICVEFATNSKES